jgi:hypothetical protein
MLTTGEMYGNTMRSIESVEEVEGTGMVGVEHLGSYVFEMTKVKVQQLGGDAVVEEVGDEMVVEEDRDIEEEGKGEGEEDDDPLHEGVGPE